MYTMITAHSGCDGTPDNSLEFIAHALTCGADALEVDVRAWEDGTLYLSHDAADVPCPTLEQAFAMLKGSSLQINCDLKDDGLELAVKALAQELGVWEQVLYSGAVSTELMLRDESVRVRTLLNHDRLLGGTDPRKIGEDLDLLVASCRRWNAHTVNIYHRLCTDAMIDRLHSEGLRISAWTVNEPEQAQRLLRKGVFNITSRKPGMVKALRGGK